MDPKRFTRRLVALGAAMFLVALVFVVTLFDAQIVHGDDYLAKSIRTNAKVETVKGTRGVITDRNGKVLNLASNYASLFTYLMSGLVVFSVGIPCAISGIAGNLLGSHFALRKGAKFIRPMMLVVLVLLLCKLISDAVL